MTIATVAIDLTDSDAKLSGGFEDKHLSSGGVRNQVKQEDINHISDGGMNPEF